MSNEPDIITEPTALEAITRGEVDVQVVTAKRFPRSITRFEEQVSKVAERDAESAGMCYYSLRRKGRDGVTIIEGGSIRLAEIMAASWGNIRAESRIVDEGKEYVTAQASCWDLENNVAVRSEVRMRIVGRSGKRYGTDMIGVTCNAAASKALRNAIFRIIPRSYINDTVARCKQVVLGEVKALSENRKQALEWLESKGVDRKRVFAVLGRDGVEDITVDDLAELRGMATAVRDGEAGLDELFPPLTAEDAPEMQPGRHEAKRKQKPEPEPEPQSESPSEPTPEATPDDGLKDGERELLGMVSKAETTDDIALLINEVDRRKLRKKAAAIIIDAINARHVEISKSTDE
jgi:hypothetical protein